MINHKNRILRFVIILLICLGIAWLSPSPQDGSYGAWSLLPALATIVMCFATHNVLMALFCGILVGGLVSGQYNLVDSFLVPSLGTENYAQILLVYLWALGGLLGLWNRTGGAQHFAHRVAEKTIRSRTSAKFFAWVMGVVFHQGGTISTVLAGTTVRPVSDQHRVAHEELAYVVDSTASPVATLIPFNVWPIYVAGLITIGPLQQWIPDEQTAIQMFYQSIPYNLYAWLAVIMTLLFSLDRLPLLRSPMQRAVARAKTTGKLDADGAQPLISEELTNTSIVQDYSPSSIDFLAPMITLLAFCIVPLVLGGSPMVFEGFGMALVVALITAMLRGLSVKHAFEAMVTGIKGVTIGAIVLGLAVTLGTVSSTLGTADFVIDATLAYLDKLPYVLPALLMFISMLVAFSIGSSWGTYAVMFPLALPLAFAISPEMSFILICFGALLGGAVFGDQCSPISDTTILSSLACGSDVMAHVRTQLPLALTAASIAAVIYTLWSFWIL